jgi:ribosomal protein S27AE
MQWHRNVQVDYEVCLIYNKSIPCQINIDHRSFHELIYTMIMPIEVNRVNRECPKCKNPTIFNTGKEYFCGKCLSTHKINQVVEKIAE